MNLAHACAKQTHAKRFLFRRTRPRLDALPALVRAKRYTGPDTLPRRLRFVQLNVGTAHVVPRIQCDSSTRLVHGHQLAQPVHDAPCGWQRKWTEAHFSSAESLSG